MPGRTWRLFERWLGRHVPPDRLGPLLGELLSDYERCIRERGRLRARLWLFGDSASLILAYRRRSRHRPRQRLADQLRLDGLHVWRSIRARPAATLATVCVLSLGIGLAASMFVLADPYVARPLPFAQPDRLVTLSVSVHPTTPFSDLPTLEEWRGRRDLFTGLSVFGSAETVLIAGPAGGDSRITLRLLPVAANYFEVLGASAPPLADWRARRESVETPVMLTAAADRRLRALGVETTRLNELDQAGAPSGRSYVVKVALPPSFLFPAGTQYWDGVVPLDETVPLASVERSPAGLSVARAQLSVIARLQPGVTTARVAAALSTAASEGTWMPATRGSVVTARGVPDVMTGHLWPLAAGALAAGLLVLAIAAANVANLLIARGAFRRQELATREALGATAADLRRLILLEVCVLASLGGVGGLALATASLELISRVIPAQYVVLGAPAISLRVVGFALLASCGVVAIALTTALTAWRMRPLGLFDRTSIGEPRGVAALRFVMTASQTAVAAVLIVAAMLLARSYAALLSRDPGYASDMFAVGVQYGSSTAGTPLRVTVDVTMDRLRRLDGVSSVAAKKGTLVEDIGGGRAGHWLRVDGQRVTGFLTQTSHGFFETARARLLQGRLLVPADGNGAAVVSETFARSCCSDRSPLGRRIEWTGPPSGSVEIVGVIRDIISGPLDRNPPPTVFYPIIDDSGGWVTYVLRAEAPGPAFASLVSREIRTADRQARIEDDGGLMRDRLMRSIHDRTFATLVVGFFAVAAIGVSAAGIFGIVAFVVTRRTREIAIRLAIGAGPSHVTRLVVRDATIAAAVGAAIGLAAGAALSRTMTNLLFGIAPADPLSMVLAAACLIAIVAVSSWMPVRRAISLTPSQALRVE